MRVSIESQVFLSIRERELVELAKSRTDILVLLKGVFELLEQYPGSEHIQWVTKNVIDRCVKLFKNKKNDILKQKVFSAIIKNITFFSMDFILELSSRLYWSQAYDESYLLLKEVYKKELHNDDFLNQTARAAYTVGDNKFAKSVCQKLITQYSGSKFIPENLYRLGLIQIKLEEYDGAISSFNRLLLANEEGLRARSHVLVLGFIHQIKQKAKS